MGAGTSRSGSATSLSDAGAFVRQQAATQKAAAEKQYAIDQRSEYERIFPDQSSRNKVSFEDATADRRPAAQKAAAQKAAAEKQYAIDRGRRSSNNTGIAFGPGRSDRGAVGPGRSDREAIFKDTLNTLEAIKQKSGSKASYFEDTLNALDSAKKNYDQRGSSNNTGIAVGPGRSDRDAFGPERSDRDVFNLGRERGS